MSSHDFRISCLACNTQVVCSWPAYSSLTHGYLPYCTLPSHCEASLLRSFSEPLPKRCLTKCAFQEMEQLLELESLTIYCSAQHSTFWCVSPQMTGGATFIVSVDLILLSPTMSQEAGRKALAAPSLQFLCRFQFPFRPFLGSRDPLLSFPSLGCCFPVLQSTSWRG